MKPTSPTVADLDGHIKPTSGPLLPGVDDVRGVAAAPSARSEPHFYAELGRVAFAAVWIGICILHLVCAAYLIAGGWLYQMLPPTKLIGNLGLYSLVLSLKYFPAISIAHYVVAAAHCRFLVMPTARFMYRHATRLISRKVKPIEGVRDKHAKTSTSPFVNIKRVPTFVYACLFAGNGLFSVESKYFETVFLVRELIETSLQTNQAFTMSRLLPRRMLNRFYVVVLVINCWSTPFLSYSVKHQPTKRLLCLLSDLVLDFISSVWVPVYLACSYVVDYDPAQTDFPRELWYTDKWLVNMMHESPIILLNSVTAAGSRLWFSISLLVAMEDIKTLVRRRKTSEKGHKRAASSVSPRVAASKGSSSIVNSATSSRAMSLIRTAILKRDKIHKWAHLCMVVIGFVVVALHVQAETKPDTPGCVMELRPWLLKEQACALIEVNCHMDKSLTGNMTNFDSSFGLLHPSSLTFVAYRHCPQIELGPRFVTFQNLVGIKMYNSTVVTWGDDAAIAETRHPNLCMAFFVYTNFTNEELPLGLTIHKFPNVLRDIEFIATNLKGLPTVIGSHWPTGMTLLMEKGELATIPNELVGLRPYAVSLSGNKITDLTQYILDAESIEILVLSGNPIERLSDTLNGTQCTLRAVLLDSTQLRDLPEWMNAAFLEKTIIIADKTPLCTELLLQPESTATQELLARRPHLGSVICMGSDYDGSSRYPLAVEIRADEV